MHSVVNACIVIACSTQIAHRILHGGSFQYDGTCLLCALSWDSWRRYSHFRDATSTCLALLCYRSLREFPGLVSICVCFRVGWYLDVWVPTPLGPWDACIVNRCSPGLRKCMQVCALSSTPSGWLDSHHDICITAP